jgi:murein DD-endopeptidase MepM/ murein hydrolase activator NlpD
MEVRLTVCAALFVVAVFIKVLFPGFMSGVGERIGASFDYKSALTALGEGLSGEKKLTTALGEAWTYAFKWGSAQPHETPDGEQPASAPAFAQTPDSADEASADDGQPAEPATDPPASYDMSQAIIAAFMESQKGYSDYMIPAGVTYDMPTLGIAYEVPSPGIVTSHFGYRRAPGDGQVKFHYGVDIATRRGSPIKAFADGVVSATGESTSYGSYLILSHGELETQYAHCEEILVESGQAVKLGETIATVGDSGNATSECLHFEVRLGGEYLNPEYYFTWL